jgi:hypothetical protein
VQASRPDDPPVPLGDAAIAADIARAARRGHGADRSPTLEQLLAAFGEHEPDDRARQRVKAALDLAGIQVRPDVLDAPEGERVHLAVTGGGGGQRSGGSRALVGLLGLAAVVAVAAIAAAIAGQGDGSSADEDLPPEPTAGVTATTGTTTTGPTTTATETPPATTQTTPAQTQTRSAAKPSAGQRAAARRRRAAARRQVTVRVDASRAPTFLCADDGAGRQLFSGTLSGRRTFRARRVRLNIGLASTTVRVNGKPVALEGSPAGVDITRSGTRTLPLGQRPCG